MIFFVVLLSLATAGLTYVVMIQTERLNNVAQALDALDRDVNARLDLASAFRQQVHKEMTQADAALQVRITALEDKTKTAAPPEAKRKTVHTPWRVVKERLETSEAKA